jgi:hypothetical protein
MSMCSLVSLLRNNCAYTSLWAFSCGSIKSWID